MPLTKKGMKIRKAMEKYYGKKKGNAVFYASENKGSLGEGVVRNPEGAPPNPRKRSIRWLRLGSHWTKIIGS